MKLAIFLLALSSSVLWGQSPTCTINAPNSGSWSGWQTTNQVSVNISNAPSAWIVQYWLDAQPYPMSYPGQGPGPMLGRALVNGNMTNTASIPVDTYYWGSGHHTIIVWGFDANASMAGDTLSTPLFTCQRTVVFSNTWPISWAPDWSVTPSTSFTATWSGIVTATAALTGTGAGSDTCSSAGTIDGFPVTSAVTPITCSSNASLTFDTRGFADGQHVVCVQITDNTGGTVTSHFSQYFGYGPDPCWSVAFQQSATTPFGIVTDATELFLAPGGSHQITSAVVNTDGTTTSGTAQYLATDTTATVTSGGLATILASGNVWNPQHSIPGGIQVMIPTQVGSNLQMAANGGAFLPGGSTWPANAQMIQITGGSGWTAGLYQINVYTIGTTFIQLECGGATLPACPATTGTMNGQYAVGPTTTVWMGAWPQNHTGCMEKDGTMHSQWNVSCVNMHEMFCGGDCVGWVTSTPPIFPSIYTQWGRLHVSAFETPIAFSISISGHETTSSCSGYSSLIGASVTRSIATTNTIEGALTFLSFAAIYNNVPGSVYAVAYGGLSQCTPPFYQDVLQQWGALGNVPAGTYFYGADENHLSPPLQGPITFNPSVPLSQNWFNGGSITASGGTCTTSIVSAGPRTFSGSPAIFSDGNPPNNFIIHGSGITNLDNPVGQLYQYTKTTGGNFTFVCTGVPNNTYNASNASGLILEPLTGPSWTGVSNMNYLPYDSLAVIYQQGLATIGPRPKLAGNPQGSSVATDGVYFAMWNGVPSLYTQSLGSVNKVTDYAGIYTESGNQSFMLTRSAAYFLQQLGWIPWTMKQMYGTGYDPTIPIAGITQSSLGSYYGFQGDTGCYGTGSSCYAIASCSGNTITFSTPHNIKNIIAGMTRLYIYGATDVGSPTNSCNNSYYVMDAPDPYTLHVVLAVMDFTTGGQSALSPTATITYSNGAIYSGSGGAGSMSSVNVSTKTLLNSGWTMFSTNVWKKTINKPAVLYFNGTTGTNVLGRASIVSPFQWAYDSSNPGFLYVYAPGNVDPSTTYTSPGILLGTAPMTAQKQVSGGFNGLGKCAGDSFQYQGTADPTYSRNIGYTFTVSGATGTGSSSLNSRTFWLVADNISGTTQFNQMCFQELPVLNSTGGSATIITNQNLILGPRNWLSFAGPSAAWDYGEMFEAAKWDRWGTRAYQNSTYMSGWSAGFGFGSNYTPTTFGYSNSVDGQIYAWPFFENWSTYPIFMAQEFGSKMFDYATPYMDQRLPSPYCGPQVLVLGYPGVLDCSAGTTAGKGSAMAALNSTDGPQAWTVNLAPYITSGQSYYCLVGNYASISAITVYAYTTTTHTFTLQPEEWGQCIFPSTFAGTLNQPTVAIKTSDCGTAVGTHAVVHFAYDPYYLNVSYGVLDLGTTGLGTLPADLTLNARSPGNRLWYQIICETSANAPLTQHPATNTF